jgi:hypothetical protein
MKSVRRIWKHLLRLENKIDAWHYLVGKYRYKLFYSPYSLVKGTLMRTHIREQIIYRIYKMQSACYDNGECILCGCETTALQMASKECPKPCYPKMMSKKKWKNSTERNSFKAYL